MSQLEKTCNTYVSRETDDGNTVGVTANTTTQRFDNIADKLFSVFEIVGLERYISQAQVIMPLKWA